MGVPGTPHHGGVGTPHPLIPKKGVPGPPKMTKRYPFLKLWGALGPAVWGHGVTPYPGQKGGGTPPFLAKNAKNDPKRGVPPPFLSFFEKRGALAPPTSGSRGVPQK